MPRTDRDTGLQAATLVAAVRAVATRRGLIRDSLAEPLVRAVGTETLPSYIRDRLLNGVNELSAAHSRFAADYDANSEHRDVGEYLRDRGWVTVSATLNQDAEVPVTRCVTAVRNVVAPTTLDS